MYKRQLSDLLVQVSKGTSVETSIKKRKDWPQSACATDVVVGPQAMITTSLNVEGDQVKPEPGAPLKQMFRQLKKNMKIAVQYNTITVCCCAV